MHQRKLNRRHWMQVAGAGAAAVACGGVAFGFLTSGDKARARVVAMSCHDFLSNMDGMLVATTEVTLEPSWIAAAKKHLGKCNHCSEKLQARAQELGAENRLQEYL